VNGGSTIHGGFPSHPLPVDVVSATEATNDIDAVQQPEQLDSVETTDGFVAEPRTKGKNIRQNHRHQDARAQEIVELYILFLQSIIFLFVFSSFCSQYHLQTGTVFVVVPMANEMFAVTFISMAMTLVDSIAVVKAWPYS